MTIESVEKYKGETLCITFNTGKKIFLHRDIVNEYNLSPGVQLQKKQLDEVMYASELRRAKRRAMYLINERDYSYVELYRKLEKNYSEEVCSETVKHMAANGYINDRRYAMQLAERYMECRLYGPRRAMLEMKKRGIPDCAAKAAVEEYSEGIYERLEEIVERKYSDLLDDPKDYKSIAKVKNALARLGYDFSDINSVVNEFLYDE